MYYGKISVWSLAKKFIMIRKSFDSKRNKGVASGHYGPFIYSFQNKIFFLKKENSKNIVPNFLKT